MIEKTIPSGFILELEKNNEAEQSTFYRYRFGKMKFWFSQRYNGDIYQVHTEIEDIPCEIYVNCDSFYPTQVCANYEPNFKWANSQNLSYYIAQLQNIDYYRIQLLNFFATSWHAYIHS